MEKSKLIKVGFIIWVICIIAIVVISLIPDRGEKSNDEKINIEDMEIYLNSHYEYWELKYTESNGKNIIVTRNEERLNIIENNKTTEITDEDAEFYKNIDKVFLYLEELYTPDDETLLFAWTDGSFSFNKGNAVVRFKIDDNSLTMISFISADKVILFKMIK